MAASERSRDRRKTRLIRPVRLGIGYVRGIGVGCWRMPECGSVGNAMPAAFCADDPAAPDHAAVARFGGFATGGGVLSGYLHHCAATQRQHSGKRALQT